jgi:hypothetical protein
MKRRRDLRLRLEHTLKGIVRIEHLTTSKSASFQSAATRYCTSLPSHSPAPSHNSIKRAPSVQKMLAPTFEHRAGPCSFVAINLVLHHHRVTYAATVRRDVVIVHRKPLLARDAPRNDKELIATRRKLNFLTLFSWQEGHDYAVVYHFAEPFRRSEPEFPFGSGTLDGNEDLIAILDCDKVVEGVVKPLLVQISHRKSTLSQQIRGEILCLPANAPCVLPPHLSDLAMTANARAVKEKCQEAKLSGTNCVRANALPAARAQRGAEAERANHLRRLDEGPIGIAGRRRGAPLLLSPVASLGAAAASSIVRSWLTVPSSGHSASSRWITALKMTPAIFKFLRLGRCDRRLWGTLRLWLTQLLPPHMLSPHVFLEAG